MATYVERYFRGEYTRVWDELLALGSRVREERLFLDAWAVARETMRRVCSNLDDILIPRLSEIGYEFGYGWEDDEFGQGQDPVRTLPPPDILQLLDDFEQKMGPIPLSLRAFNQEVGGVNLSGFLPKRLFVLLPNGTSCSLFEVTTGRGSQGPDPLYVYRPEPDLFDAVVRGKLTYRDPESDGSLMSELPIAPDSFHKINVSGLGGYDIHIPDAAADAKLVGEWHKTTFVNYLRICCSWAGLPGLEGFHFFSEEEREYLSKDLLPF
jgi:hypothetical protein